MAEVVPKRKTAGHTRMGVDYSYIRMFQFKKKKGFPPCRCKLAKKIDFNSSGTLNTSF